MSNWLFFTVIAGLASSLFNTLLRQNLRDGNDPTAYAWWFELSRTIFFLCLIPFFPGIIFSPSNLLLLLILGTVEFIGVYLYMKMHSLNQLSLSTVLAQLRSVWVPFFAFFILGEKLNLWQWLGILCIFLGAVIVSRPRSLRVDRGVIYAITVTLVSAFSNVIMKKTVGFASFPLVLFSFSFPSVILIPLFMKNPLTRLRRSTQMLFKYSFPASAANIVSMSALTAAFSFGEASRVTAVFQGVAMLSVAAGIIILHERDHKNEKIFASILTIVGIVLLL